MKLNSDEEDDDSVDIDAVEIKLPIAKVMQQELKLQEEWKKTRKTTFV